MKTKLQLSSCWYVFYLSLNFSFLILHFAIVIAQSMGGIDFFFNSWNIAQFRKQGFNTN